MRHIASAGRDYDKKSDFASPDSRGGITRTAGHRYMGEVRMPSVRPDRLRGQDGFSAKDFKARWWPAPGE
jgi:hypothetical protein